MAGFGADQLFRNNGDGTFTDVTAQAGVGDPLWSASAAFADIDNDGDLDLLVVNYVDFTLTDNKDCGDPKRKLRGYCHPDVYNPAARPLLPQPGERHLRGRHAGRRARAARSGPGSAWSFGDIDNDGWQDFYVANDNKPNFLFRNKGNGTFEDISVLSGTALGDTGPVRRRGWGSTWGTTTATACSTSWSPTTSWRPTPSTRTWAAAPSSTTARRRASPSPR